MRDVIKMPKKIKWLLIITYPLAIIGLHLALIIGLFHSFIGGLKK